MIARTRAAAIAALLVPGCLPALIASTVQSPGKRIQVTVEIKKNLEPYPAGERLYYSATFDGKPLLLDSPFRLDFKGMPSIAGDLAIKDERRRAFDENWKPAWGTRSPVHNRANELELAIAETSGLDGV